MNPLLDFSGLPRFAEITPQLVAPAIDELLKENRLLIRRLLSDGAPATWDDFVQPLEDASEHLNRAWGQVAHLNAVMNSPELREAYNENLPNITQYQSELAQNQGLYEKFKALRAGSEFERLSRAQRQIVENELRDFRLGGAELPEERKVRFLQIQEELAKIYARFEENLLDATNDFALYVNSRDEVAGLPDDILEVAREAAAHDGRPGWKLTLHAPSWIPAMMYAENRPLRETLYRAYVTRASEFGKPEWDNTPLIPEILRLRQEKAVLLGYRSYAEVSLIRKMVKSPRDVLDFLAELGSKAKPHAERDYQELKQFAGDELKIKDFQAWDIAFASEKLRTQRYAFSEQEVKQYFPEFQVIQGMFNLVEALYGISIKQAQAPVWHPDVRFFDIRDMAGNLIGQFYADLYARPSKRSGAWMDEAIARRRKESGIQIPVAYLNCNFSSPVGGNPALFTHDEVITLFHEFGHGLHHLLTSVDQLGVSGINGVEWDAVELPSQFMENFCWEWDVLKHLTLHLDRAEPMPRSLYDKILAAKNFQSGMQTVRQLEFALFDMHLHHDFDPQGDKTMLQLLHEIRSQVAVVVPPEYNRFPNNFSHIFAGGYAAGYYSYKWAEVLSADAYSLFEENGIVNRDIGRRFREEILSVGGSRPALESFVAFRGRRPQIDALLRHNGMASAPR
ncbi:MAG TPA: M3 family metallopeptidase [Burkholderiales bacterium]|nr:M3 family metallopeptidase [Burkholderiales bacterium]